MTIRSGGILIPVLLLICAMISIQSGATLAKSLFPLIGSEGVTALRLCFSTIILLIVFKPWKRRLQKGYRHYLFFYGIALGCMNFLFYQALKTLPLGIAVGLEFTGPLAVALFSSRRPIDFLWITLVVVGLLFLLPIGNNTQNIDLTGVLYALSAGVCWALYIIYGQKAGAYYGTATVAIGSTIAALIFFPVGLIISGPVIFKLEILPLALAVAIFSSALPYALEMMALTRMPRKTFGTLTSLEPAFGALSGLIFLGERLYLSQWAALVAIIIAAMGASMSSNTQKQKKDNI